MLCLITDVPRCCTDRCIAASFLHLAKPRHIAAGGLKSAVKRKLSKFRLPGIRNQKSLSLGKECIPVIAPVCKLHCRRPQHLYRMQSLLAERNPLHPECFIHSFDPDNRLEGIRCSRKSRITAPDAASDAEGIDLMGNLLCIQETVCSLCKNQFRCLFRIRIPDNAVFFDPKSQRLFIEHHSKRSAFYFFHRVIFPFFFIICVPNTRKAQRTRPPFSARFRIFCAFFHPTYIISSFSTTLPSLQILSRS